MMATSTGERNRILNMIESGQITAGPSKKVNGGKRSKTIGGTYGGAYVVARRGS